MDAHLGLGLSDLLHTQQGDLGISSESLGGAQPPWAESQRPLQPDAGSRSVIAPEYDGQHTDTSEPERREERTWTRRRVPEDAEEDRNQNSKDRKRGAAFQGGTDISWNSSGSQQASRSDRRTGVTVPLL